MVLPANYNHLVQAMIYTNISEKLAEFLHDHGFPFEKRQFKLFTFSRLLGRYRIKKNGSGKSQIVFSSNVCFYLSSPFEMILQEFANRMVSGMPVFLGNNRLFVESVQVLLPPVFNGKITKIKMLSPMTIRSTLRQGDGSAKTHYYSPKEKEFPRLIRENVLKKYYAFSGEIPSETEFLVTPYLFSVKKNLHHMSYKGFMIDAYNGIYTMEGSRELKQFAYDAGLGERNSQGFGMFEIWQERKE
jgi:CRISPR-associated endoribonuclease Cas6